MNLTCGNGKETTRTNGQVGPGPVEVTGRSNQEERLAEKNQTERGFGVDWSSGRAGRLPGKGINSNVMRWVDEAGEEYI